VKANDYNRILGEVMKKEREEMGLSQTEVAKRMGISPAYLSQLEHNRRRIYMELIEPWCEKVGVSPTFLLERYVRYLQPKEGKMQEYKRMREYKETINEGVELGLGSQIDATFTFLKKFLQVKEKERKGKRRGVKKEREWSKSVKENLSQEEFVVRAIKKLRKPPYKGIHTVYSGLNEAWKKYYGTDPVEEIQKLSQQGKIKIRPAKGGAVIYLPGEGPGPKNVLDIILEWSWMTGLLFKQYGL
jgi:transcriptional regulator with XRE-family HTH domain